MSKLTQSERNKAKLAFFKSLQGFVSRMGEYASADDGEWTVKGFIDIYRNIYTISSDTKIVSKILEIHLFPQILRFAEEQNYSTNTPVIFALVSSTHAQIPEILLRMKSSMSRS